MSAAVSIKSGGGRPTAYRTKAGVKVPGVTSILSRVKDSGGLIHWAWQQGIDGKDYRQTRDEAGDVGHLSHDWVDCTIRGQPLAEPPHGMSDEDIGKAQKALDSFKRWRDQTKFELVETEMPCVSELWKYGGTRDALVRCNGAVKLGDWKSGNNVYREHVMQVAAYRQLAREQGHAIGEAIVLRFGKIHGDFTHYDWPESAVDVGWDGFKWALGFYLVDQQLKEIVR